MSHEDPGPIVQRILLGAELRDAREEAGLSPTDANAKLGWYAGKLSKIEHGDMKITDRDLARIALVYDIDKSRVGRLRTLATEARRKLPPSRVPEWATKYVNLERAATRLRFVYLDAFPGAVQTADYAQAMLLRSVVVARSEVDRMAEDRQRRAELIKAATTTRVSLIVGEEAILRQVGGSDVMRGQLQLVRDLAELPHITVQALPLASGAHAAHGVTFVLVTLLEDRPGLVYSEGLSGSDYLGREHYRVYSLVFDALTAAAMSPEDTMALIDRQLR